MIMVSARSPGAFPASFRSRLEATTPVPQRPMALAPVGVRPSLYMHVLLALAASKAVIFCSGAGRHHMHPICVC